MSDREVAEGYRGGKRQASLVADAMFGGGGDIAGCVEARDGMTPLVDHPSSAVRQQANRGSAGRMQLDAVEWRFFDGPETGIGTPRSFRGRELPLVIATMKIVV